MTHPGRTGGEGSPWQDRQPTRINDPSPAAPQFATRNAPIVPHPPPGLDSRMPTPQTPPPVDYPAAHSMDSCWFAVDESGEVAFFDTGEGGALPTDEAFPKGREAGGDTPFDIDSLMIAALTTRATAVPALQTLLFDTPNWADALRHAVYELPESEMIGLLAWLGIYHYGCDDAVASPYERGAAVPEPLQAHRLPPELARRLDAALLPLRFAAAPRIAVPALVPSEAWSDRWSDLDGVVRRLDGGPVDDEEAADFSSFGLPTKEERLPLSEAAALAVLTQLFARPLPPPVSAPTPPPGGLWVWLQRLFGR
jgi:hypothetical protein